MCLHVLNGNAILVFLPGWGGITFLGSCEGYIFHPLDILILEGPRGSDSYCALSLMARAANLSTLFLNLVSSEESVLCASTCLTWIFIFCPKSHIVFHASTAQSGFPPIFQSLCFDFHDQIAMALHTHQESENMIMECASSS